MSVLMISRTRARLEEARQEILAKVPNAVIELIAEDLGAGRSTGVFTRVAAQLDVERRDIGVLVNNVGASYPHAMYFDELSDEQVTELIELNINTMNWMTRLVLPGMKARKRGAIVNISSAAGVITDPLYAVYSGTKAYVDFFSRALDAEYRSVNVHVQSQIPYFVTTKLAKLRHASFTIPNPATYVRAAVRAIGYEASIVPYWPHALQHWLVTSLPDWLLERYLLGLHKDLRARAMKKK